MVSKPNWAKIEKKIKWSKSTENWYIAALDGIFYESEKKLKKNFRRFFFSKKNFKKIFKKKSKKKFPNFFFIFFLQIHKIYHLGLLCTNFQCSGIIFFFKFGLPTKMCGPFFVMRYKKSEYIGRILVVSSV